MHRASCIAPLKGAITAFSTSLEATRSITLVHELSKHLDKPRYARSSLSLVRSGGAAPLVVARYCSYVRWP